MKKFKSILLLIVLVFSSCSAFASDTGYKDTENHWARAAIEEWSNYGVINGYDGFFRPDDSITRGEFAAVLNRVFKYETAAENTFTDLDEDFYTEHILCLKHEGIMTGYENKIRPNDCITRQEAGVMLFKALKLSADKTFEEEFSDVNEVSGWALDAMITLANKGYFKGDNNFLKPLDNITRAETVALLDNADVFVLISEAAEEAEEAEEKDAAPLTEYGENTAENSEAGGIEQSEGEEAAGTENTVTEDESIEDEIIDEAPQEDLEDNGESEGTEELKPSITSTLEDGAIHKNSRLVFDVIARDKDGNKIESYVKLSGVDIVPSWDDDEKTSYTVEFSESGEYIVEITASDSDGVSETVSYTINYEMAEYGEVIGSATVCIEAFTVGAGYIAVPVVVDIYEGVNCAYILDEFLTANNMTYMNSGSLDGGFYLSSVSDMPDFTPDISESMTAALEGYGMSPDSSKYTPNQLSEFDFTEGSGWMYSVNGVFPNMGFSEYYLQDGDVLRIQFTLAYGADIGGSNKGVNYGESFFETVNREELTRKVAEIGAENCGEYIDIITKADLTAEELDAVLEGLK